LNFLPLAHGIGGVRDLPVPVWLFYYGGGIVLVVSFVALGVLWRRPRLAGQQGRPLPEGLQRVLLHPALRVALQSLSFGLLVVVWLAAAFGSHSVLRNLAPTFVWVIFWLGVVALVVLLGNVWTVLNPWRAAADGVAWLWERGGGRWQPVLRYPDRFGRWPAAVLLFAFAALELTYPDPSDPRVLAIAIALYSWIAWTGALAFGRRTWFENGEAFTVYFGLLSRVSPFAVRERDGRREIVVRPPLSGLAVEDWPPGTLPFVAVMLGSVAFDGFSRTTWWQQRLYDAQSPHVASSPRLADFIGSMLNLSGLLIAVLVVCAAYLLAVAVARLVARSSRSLTEDFLGSLVPIALAYVVAHYFSLFVLQGQFAIPLASDPFGKDWNLFGTDGFRPNLALLSPNLVWYVQVGALVVGHVCGLMLAHDRAVALFRSGPTAVRTQYAMLVLMIGYTVTGMWILSQS
jgi:hypothetical protein